MANRVDPDQTLHTVAYKLDLHCCSGLSVPILRDITAEGSDQPAVLDKLCTVELQ